MLNICDPRYLNSQKYRTLIFWLTVLSSNPELSFPTKCKVCEKFGKDLIKLSNLRDVNASLQSKKQVAQIIIALAYIVAN